MGQRGALGLMKYSGKLAECLDVELVSLMGSGHVARRHRDLLHANEVIAGGHW